MHATLKSTIISAMEDITVSFFTMDFLVISKTAIEIGDKDRYEPPDTDITAIVGFNGEIEGGLHLAAPAHVALILSHAFSGDNHPEINDVVTDSFGELANILAGSVKERLSENGLYNIALTPPMVATGRNNTFKYSTLMNSTKQYFTIGNAPFLVEVFY